MKKALRLLFLQHLRRPKHIWALACAITLLLGWGAMRVERRLDLMSLLPKDDPIVKASIQAGVGQDEILWVVLEGTADDLDARRRWAAGLMENLLEHSGMPMNGILEGGGISPPIPFPAEKGVSLWPPLLAADGLMGGDLEAMRLLTAQLYALAPVLLGDRLAPLRDPKWLKEHLKATATALRSLDPVGAKIAQIDPLCLRDLIDLGDFGVVTESGASTPTTQITQKFAPFPLKIHDGCVETKDSRYLLLPLVLNFPNGESAATARMLAWVGAACAGPPPQKASFRDVQETLSPSSARSFQVQVTGAHAIAYWESSRLGREVVLSLCISFVLIGVVYWVGFRTLAGYVFVVVPLLLAMLWTLGLAGWILGRLNLMAAAFGAVLLGVGDDVGILIFSRYRDECAAGKTKALALRAALLSTGPGVIAAMTATSLVFLSCALAPFPGLRDLGITAGLGILACMASTFLVMPPMLLAFDKGRGAFAASPQEMVKDQRPSNRKSFAKAIVAATVIVIACIGATRLSWEEDLRRFRQSGNPALSLQEDLAKVLSLRLQPLAVQIPLNNDLPQRWNAVAETLKKGGFQLPHWASMDKGLADSILDSGWRPQVLKLAEADGLDSSTLEPLLATLQASIADPLTASRSLSALLDPKSEGGTGQSGEKPMLTLPVRLSDEAQDSLAPVLEDAGARLIGTRPLFRALKATAKHSMQEVIVVAMVCIFGVAALFGRRWIFLALALAPMAAGQAAVLGTLGWSGEPLTFLSLIAIPVTLGVSIDTVFNLLNRAKHEVDAPAKVSRVNAVCAGTTLAGFGGLAFSGYKALQGLGMAAIGGTAVALLTTQWLLPWLMARIDRGRGKGQELS